MLTRAAPAFNRATDGQMPPALAQALSQALFNCAQPLEHRGPVAFGNASFPQRGGVLSQSGWNPGDYPELFPNLQDGGFVEAPGNGGYRAGDWYSTYYGSPQFDLRTSLTQNLNQYYAGPSVTIEGDTYIQNVTVENVDAGNVNADTINGEPAPGKDGARGPAGPQGQSGEGDLYQYFLFYQKNSADMDPRIATLWGVVTRLLAFTQELDRRIRSLQIVGWPQGSNVLAGASFDEENCAVVEKKRPVRLRIR